MGRSCKGSIADHEEVVQGILVQICWAVLVIVDNDGVLVLRVEAIHAKNGLSNRNLSHYQLRERSRRGQRTVRKRER